ncbi:hypothetical protein GT147_004541 [Salmonella enterica]|nr:hypothetical protein [Salmonella enterica subsp. enterica serovar Infantis]EDW6859307.1 hypothetical protein [Salmonella enterica]EEJ5734871.1 hypothetical protein [Salmonella enterica]
MVGGDNELLAFVYRMLQSKMSHVQRSTDKAITFYRSMVDSVSKNRDIVNKTTQTVNRIYAFRSRIKTKTEKLEESEKRYGRKVVSLLDEVIHDLECVSSNTLHYSAVMKSNTDSLLITILKARHYQWRENVYMSVLGRTNTMPTDDKFSCFLGWWYYGEGKKKFSGIPAFIRLGSAHSRLHQVTAELAKEDLQNPDIRTLTGKLEEFEAVSVSVIMALDELDDYLMTLAGQEYQSPGIPAADEKSGVCTDGL